MEQSKQDNTISATSYPVPFGHVLYTPSLPAAMGPIWDFPTEWWFYAGWATDVSGTKQFTILVQTIRVASESAALLYGVGANTVGSSKQLFSAHSALGTGEFPTPTSTSWSTSMKTTGSMESSMNCKLTSGILGLRGATYQVDMADTTNNVAMSLKLKDNLGLILEGPSGAFHKAGGSNSYEYAMPALNIEEGSTITIDKELFNLASGNLWLDRQTIGGPTGESYKAVALGSQHGQSSKELYTGNWLAAVMNDQTCYNLCFFWPKKPQQWIVGTEVHPPVYPLGKFGLMYPALRTWDGQSPVQGVNVLESTDFDLNILKPDNPSQSPHWTSPTSGHTYCSAWHLRIKDHVYTIRVLVPGSEVNFMGSQYFFEGAAIITDENGCKVGNIYMEQMGFN